MNRKRRLDAEGQLAFDIEGMIHAAAVEAAPPWDGAPLHVTTDFHPVRELEAAFAHWQFLHPSATYTESRMWHRAIATPEGAGLGDHGFDLLTADLRCDPWLHDAPRGTCSCIGDLMHQAICEPCGWNAIGTEENTPVEAWHDHALPRWRDLPVVPARILARGYDTGTWTKPALAWIREHYPASMQYPGAPIITERSRYGTRHVPGRSPWGGYDLSHTALTPAQPRATGGRRRRHAVPTTKPVPPAAQRPTRPANTGLGIGN